MSPFLTSGATISRARHFHLCLGCQVSVRKSEESVFFPDHSVVRSSKVSPLSCVVFSAGKPRSSVSMCNPFSDKIAEMVSYSKQERLNTLPKSQPITLLQYFHSTLPTFNSLHSTLKRNLICEHLFGDVVCCI